MKKGARFKNVFSKQKTDFNHAPVDLEVFEESFEEVEQEPEYGNEAFPETHLSIQPEEEKQNEVNEVNEVNSAINVSGANNVSQDFGKPKRKQIKLPNLKGKRFKGTIKIPVVQKMGLGSKMAVMNGVLIMTIIAGVFLIASRQANTIIKNEVLQKFNIISESVTDKIVLNNMTVESFANIISKTAKVKVMGDFMSGKIDVEPGAEVHEILKSYVDANNTLVDSIFITDVNGIVKAEGTEGKYLGQGFIDRGFFQQSKGGKSTWSDIYTSKIDNKPVRFYCVPLKNSAGAISGVIGVVVKVEYMYKVLDAVNVGESGVVYLIDNQKKFAYHPDPAMRQQNVSSMENSTLPQATQNLASGVSNQFFYVENGVKRICNYTPLDNMTLLVTIEEAEVLKPVTSLKTILMIFGGIFMVIGIILAVLVSRMIVTKIKTIQSLIKQVASGDLTVEVQGKDREHGDEIHLMGKSLGEMITSLRSLIHEIADQSNTIKHSGDLLAQASDEGARAAQDISEKIQEMAVGTQEQTKFAVETDSLVKAMIDQLKDVVTEMDRLVNDANSTIESAKEGQVVIVKTIDQMNTIKSSSDESLAVMDHLIGSSKLIGNITEAISSISDQTNLLALNAAIEAARAGDAGRGFAVVAEEIRKLASQSQASASSIGKIVKEIQTEIEKANQIIRSEGKQVSEGITVIESTQEKFNDIIDKVHETAQTIKVVWGSIAQTEVKGTEVITAVEQIGDIIQNLAANAQEISASSQQQNAVSEEISASASQLTAIADDLDNVIQKFKIK